LASFIFTHAPVVFPLTNFIFFIIGGHRYEDAEVVELVDALDSKSSIRKGVRGSIPSFGTIKKFRALGPEFFYSFLISYRLAVDVKMQVYHIHHDRSPLRDLMHDSLIAPCLVEKNVLVTVTPDESLVRLLPQATSRRQP
jgi:hypothetical protein